MNSSISEALGKLRPDLNKDKKFKALSAARRTALMGDYRDPDAAPAKEGELSPAEVLVGSEINRQLAAEAQAKLVQHELFYKKHAATLGGLAAVGMLGILGFSIIGREDVHARAVLADRVGLGEKVVAAAGANGTAVAAGRSGRSGVTAIPGRAGNKAQLALMFGPPLPRAKNASSAVALADEDEIPILTGQPKLVAKLTASLSPVTRKENAREEEIASAAPVAAAKELIPADVKQATHAAPDAPGVGDSRDSGEKVVASAKPVAPAVAGAAVIDNPAHAPVVIHDGAGLGGLSDGLEDGASIANANSIQAASTPIVAAVPAADNAPAPAPGEVLYEAGDVPTASANAEAGSGSTKHKSSRKAKTAPSDDSGDDSAGGLRVSGIFWDKTRPLALINDKIVELGSTVNGAKVTAIDPSSVTISQDGKTQTLHP